MVLRELEDLAGQVRLRTMVLAGGWAVGNLGTDLVLTQVEFGERMQGVRKGRRGTRGCRVDQVKGQVEVQPCESTPT